MGPTFDVPVVNVTVVVGQTALLPCSIQHLGRHKVTLEFSSVFLLNRQLKLFESPTLIASTHSCSEVNAADFVRRTCRGLAVRRIT